MHSQRANNRLLTTSIGFLGWLIVAATVWGSDGAPSPIRLTDVTRLTGITFRHTDGGSGQRYIVESVVAGLALLDYDRDGLIDVYFLNGGSLRGSRFDPVPTNVLYRNLGNWRFRDVTRQAEVADDHHGLGVTAGDFDEDGWPDLYLNNFGPNVLYRNNGDGSFSDATGSAQVGAGELVGAGTCFLDMDHDGDLDLYAANYVDFNYENHIVRMIGPYQFHPGPKDYRPVPDILFRNEGDGSFTDVSESSGIAAVAGTGMGMICLDYDDDGDTDIFVGNDAAPNFLFQNQGDGTFIEVGLLAGVAYDGRGEETSTMGVDSGDYDNDGRLDLFLTDYSAELPVLYHNVGNGFFEDTTHAAAVGKAAFPHANWGTGLVDLDNDGDRDLFIACGHFMDNIQYIDQRTKCDVRNILLANEGNGRFRDISDRCGDGLLPAASSRGTGFDDLDNDGDLDIVILNANAQPTVLRNDTSNGNHWIQLRLRGTRANRQAVGARIRVVAGPLVQVEEVHSGRSYQSHYGTRLHFGLGLHTSIEYVEVRWPGGTVEQFRDLPVDAFHVLTEGTGVTP